jgi:hypothetical protein
MKHDYDDFGVNLNNSFNTPPAKQNIILRLLSLAVGEQVSWLEVLTAISLAVVAWFSLVLILSI